MKKVFWLAVVIAVLASFFASIKPDGLDVVAQKLGFANKAIKNQGLMANIPAPLAGVLGLVIIIGLFCLVAGRLKRH